MSNACLWGFSPIPLVAYVCSGSVSCLFPLADRITLLFSMFEEVQVRNALYLTFDVVGSNLLLRQYFINYSR